MRTTATAAAFTELEEAFFRAGDNLDSWDDDDPQPTWWSRLQDLQDRPTESLVASDDDEDWEWQIALARARATTDF